MEEWGKCKLPVCLLMFVLIIDMSACNSPIGMVTPSIVQHVSQAGGPLIQETPSSSPRPSPSASPRVHLLLMQSLGSAVELETPTLLATFTISPIQASGTLAGSPWPVGEFQPGDPTATPLGSDITNQDYVAGVKAYAVKNYQEVIRRMNIVIQANPNLAPPYRYRGMAYWYLNDCNSSMADEQKAVSLNPNYAVAWADVALNYDCQGNEEQMLVYYQKALALDPSLAFVHHNLGVYYFGIGDYDQSLSEYRLSIAIDPTRADAWDGISEVFYRMNQPDECMKAASNAINLDPTLWLAYGDRGECDLQGGYYQAAVADYQVTVAHITTDAIVWYNYGIALHGTGDFQTALAVDSRALELDPTYYPANINRGNVYIDLGEYSQALADFNTALKYGDIPAAYSGRGYVYYYLKEYDKAIAEFTISINLDPNDACSYKGLAFTYFDLGQYQDAVNAGSMVDQIDPTCGGSKLAEIQARSYYAMGNYDQALSYINRALSYGPGYPLGFYYRGIIYEAAGQDNEAIQNLEVFVRDAQLLKYNGPEVIDAENRISKLAP